MVLLHPHHGILEFLSPPLLILMLVVLWAVSIFGLFQSSFRSSTKVMLALLFILVPPTAIIWMGMELYQKYATVSGKTENGNVSTR